MASNLGQGFLGEKKSGSVVEDHSGDSPSYNNFRLPQWGYENFVSELINFRKGLHSFAGEPGWFYFKIFFHFDDNNGLLGDIINADTSKKETNTAYRYLATRSKGNSFKSCNLGQRKLMLERFVKKLASISFETPWLFDKIIGLDKAGVAIADYTSDKQIEISCLEDTIDMKLTTLFHLYQYVCYDEIMGKEIVPENLRKFNMSIMVYHIPIKFYDTAFTTNHGGVDESRSIHGSSLSYANRMSYKLYTFKQCEFDLQSMFGITPGTVDNAKPFNMAKSNIIIKYNKCFTHLMNEWDQIMVGPDGIYYDPINGIGDNTQQKNRFNIIKKTIESLSSANNGGNTVKILDKIGDDLYRVSKQVTEPLGNLYNLDIPRLQADTIMKNTGRIYLANLFDYNPVLFRGLVIKKNVASNKNVILTQLTGNNISTFNVLSNRTVGYGEGLPNLPNFRHLGNLLNNSVEYRQYHNIWFRSSTLSGSLGTSDFTSIYQLIEHANRQRSNMFGTLYAARDYRDSLRDIVDSYVNAWKNVTGWWKGMINGIKQDWTNTKNMFKF